MSVSFQKHRFQNTLWSPHVAEHQERTDSTMKRPHTRRTHQVPFIAACSHFTRKNTRFRALASSPTQVPRKIHAAITLRLAICDSTSTYNYAHMNNHMLQNTKEKPITYTSTRMVCSRRTQEVPFIAGCSHSTRKTLGFVLRLPSQHRSHARFMPIHPLQCDLQPAIQQAHNLTHT